MFSDDHYLISDQMIMQVTSLAPVVGYLGCFFLPEVELCINLGWFGVYPITQQKT